MAAPTGSADLPLHGGRVPRWLAARMERLGRVIVEAIVLEYGRDEVLARLAHPFWFQAFGAVMGMDWHSSGITTSVLAALKRGLAPVSRELGISVCGGRGRQSRRTPDELRAVGERTGIDGDQLGRVSRLVAKVDSAAVQDGFALYLHGFVVTDDGRWTVVQQGMRPESRTARRYHWTSAAVADRADGFVDAPHAAIDGEPGGAIVNLTDARAAAARTTGVALASGDPERVLTALRRLRAPSRGRDAVESHRALLDASDRALPHLRMPAHHDVRPSDVFLRRLHGTLAAAAAAGPADFAELLLVPGVGARTVEALAAVAEVVHGAPSRFADPARFALALGGKDGHPFPVPVRVYDQTLRVLRDAVERARLGNDERLAAVRRLDRQARLLEAAVEGGPTLAAVVAREWSRRAAHGGRTVWDDVEQADVPRPRRPRRGQLSLF